MEYNIVRASKVKNPLFYALVRWNIKNISSSLQESSIWTTLHNLLGHAFLCVANGFLVCPIFFNHFYVWLIPPHMPDIFHRFHNVSALGFIPLISITCFTFILHVIVSPLSYTNIHLELIPLIFIFFENETRVEL